MSDTILKLSDAELTLKIKSLAIEERHLTGTILEHIAEVDRRKLYVAMAYSSLFEYLTREIGYSAGGAQRRIDAARLLQRVPEILKDVTNGSIQLGQISKLQKACRQIKKETNANVHPLRQKEILEKLKNKTNDQTDLILAREFQMKIAAHETQRIQRDESVRVEISFTKEEMVIIRKAQDMLSHKTGGALKATIVEMAKKVATRYEPKQPRAVSTATVAVD